MDKYDSFHSSPSSIQIPDEDFQLFHSIDRLLFVKLVHNLCHDVHESMRLVAFLIWLERVGYSTDPVKRVLEWPLLLISELYDQISMCLTGLETEKLVCEAYNDLYLLRQLCLSHITFENFNEHPVRVIKEVMQIVNEVCVRAFKDVLVNPSPPLDTPIHSVNKNGTGVFAPLPMGLRVNMNLINALPPHMAGLVANGNLPLVLPTHFRASMIRENPKADLSEMFRGWRLVHGVEEEGDVEPDERTIFLTFSKGYYIPESEIREFFTSIFGDFIEEIYMQEVSLNEQPLYARMVSRSSSIVPTIAPPGTKTKYSINGKHIWAKKYVKRNRAPTSSQDQNPRVEEGPTSNVEP